MRNRTAPLYAEWLPLIDTLSDKEASLIFKNILRYQNGKDVKCNHPIWLFIKSKIDDYNDRQSLFLERQSKNGKKGGNPNFQKGKRNPYYPKKDNPEIIEDNPALPNINPKENKRKENKRKEYNKKEDKSSFKKKNIKKKKEGEKKGKEKEIKKKHGEFKNILLTDKEFNKLLQLYKNNQNLEKALIVLGNYIASKGKEYTSHYAVLNKGNWVYKNIMKDKQQQKPKYPL